MFLYKYRLWLLGESLMGLCVKLASLFTGIVKSVRRVDKAEVRIFESITTKSAGIPIKVYGELPNNFTKELVGGINQFPSKILNKIKKNNLDEIRIAPRHADAFPENPKIQKHFKKTSDKYGANGFAGSISVNNNPSLNFITLTQGKSIPADKGVVSHELGHKTDELLMKTIGINFSETEGFKQVVKADICGLSSKLESNPKVVYRKANKLLNTNVREFVANNNPSEIKPNDLREIFADCVAANTTGTQSEIMGKEKIMEFFFPESYKYVSKYLYLMGMK